MATLSIYNIQLRNIATAKCTVCTASHTAANGRKTALSAHYVHVPLYLRTSNKQQIAIIELTKTYYNIYPKRRHCNWQSIRWVVKANFFSTSCNNLHVIILERVHTKSIQYRIWRANVRLIQAWASKICSIVNRMRPVKRPGLISGPDWG